MKILQVIPTLSAAAGGPVEGLIQQGIVMTRAGHDVQTICLDSPGTRVDSRLQSSAVYLLGPSHLGYAFAWRLEPWLREHAAEYDVIVVHGIWTYHAYCVGKVARELRIPYVVFLHGMLDPWFASRYPLKHLKKWCYWPWAEYRTLRDASLVLFTTAEELRLARESFWLYKVRERLVGYGIRRREIPVGGARQAFLDRYPDLGSTRNLLYLSRLHPKKGCDLLIRAFARLAVGHPNLRLIMAGPGEDAYVQDLKTLVEVLGVAHKVIFTGMVKDKMKWGAYDCADAFVLPSHQENFGIVIAEALASGLPVLTTPQVNIWREIQDSGAGVIEPDTQDGTNRMLDQWLETPPNKAQRMRENALACFQRHFDIEIVTENLLTALRDVAERPHESHSFNGASLKPKQASAT